MRNNLVFLIFAFLAGMRGKESRLARAPAWRPQACARACYFRTLLHVAPIKIDGVVNLEVPLPVRRKKKRNYISQMEAFQNICWAYRDYTKQCLAQCPETRLKRWLQQTFFDGLESYCIKHYEDVLRHWSCHQKLRRYRFLCDRECAGSCDPTCLFHCLRPVSRRVCYSEVPVRVLLDTNGVKAPRQYSKNKYPLCIDEVVNFVPFRQRDQ